MLNCHGCEVKNLLSSMDLKIPLSLQSLFHFIGCYPSSSIVLIDEEGKISRLSTTFMQAMGYTAMELQGRPYTDILQGFTSLEDFYLHCQTHIRETNSLPKIEVKAKNGDWIVSEAFISRIIADESVEMSMLYLPHLNKKKHRTLLQQFSDSFLRNVNLGVMLFDPYGRLVEISDMACSILGHRRDCILNKTIDELFEAVPEESRLVHPSLLQGVIVRNRAIHWHNAHQGYDLLIDSNVLRDESEEIVGAYVIMKDVSNLRSLEAQLHRSDRLAMIGQIAAGTAHEIRNPLTSLRGFIQLLQSALENQKLDREVGYLTIMKNEIDRINELVNEFLLLSKPKDVRYRPISVAGTIRNILPIIESEANLYGITVSYIHEPALPLVIADSELLKQVFLNISKNAIEAMEGTGVLTIKERVGKDRQIHVDIQDTGPGIPNYIMDKIFDPFFTTKENGTGLGLAVCQRIIHDMGGYIRVRSKGYGTTFTITLPAQG